MVHRRAAPASYIGPDIPTTWPIPIKQYVSYKLRDSKALIDVRQLLADINFQYGGLGPVSSESSVAEPITLIDLKMTLARMGYLITQTEERGVDGEVTKKELWQRPHARLVPPATGTSFMPEPSPITSEYRLPLRPANDIIDHPPRGVPDEPAPPTTTITTTGDTKTTTTSGGSSIAAPFPPAESSDSKSTQSNLLRHLRLPPVPWRPKNPAWTKKKLRAIEEACGVAGPASSSSSSSSGAAAAAAAARDLKKLEVEREKDGKGKMRLVE